ncbi:hypothetical protein AB0F73_17420 [Micromonospora purpureochromogenes]|uniref:hypothetical protein n=1 Tax=Micromonospora purpureochromogenes TaxID=47872 RepID=UPI0033F72467
MPRLRAEPLRGRPGRPHPPHPLDLPAEAHLDAFRTGPHFPGFLTEIRPWIQDIEVMRHYTPTQVTSTP